MKKIKFSHKYWKMPILHERKTYLMGVSRIHYKDLPSGFIDYDTTYSDDGIITNQYPLPKTELIILVLFTDSKQTPKVWTTIRRYTPRKYEYYSNLAGQQVEIVIA